MRQDGKSLICFDNAVLLQLSHNSVVQLCRKNFPQRNNSSLNSKVLRIVQKSVYIFICTMYENFLGKTNSTCSLSCWKDWFLQSELQPGLWILYVCRMPLWTYCTKTFYLHKFNYLMLNLQQFWRIGIISLITLSHRIKF